MFQIKVTPPSPRGACDNSMRIEPSFSDEGNHEGNLADDSKGVNHMVGPDGSIHDIQSDHAALEPGAMLANRLKSLTLFTDRHTDEHGYLVPPSDKPVPSSIQKVNSFYVTKDTLDDKQQQQREREQGEISWEDVIDVCLVAHTLNGSLNSNQRRGEST